MRLSSEDYLLLCIGVPGGGHKLDRIRIMKGMFLLTNEGPQSTRALYEFKPYDWGPFSTGVYEDLRRLEANGLIATEGAPPYETYRMTGLGEQRAQELASSLSGQERAKLAEVKHLTTSLSFLDLLEYVYDKHPKYAKRSKLRR